MKALADGWKFALRPFSISPAVHGWGGRGEQTTQGASASFPSGLSRRRSPLNRAKLAFA